MQLLQQARTIRTTKFTALHPFYQTDNRKRNVDRIRELRMKAFSCCMVLWLVGVLFMSFNCLNNGVNQSMLVSGMIIVDGNTMTRSGNWKENRYSTSLDQGSYGDVSMEDYRAIDPPPSSKASVKHRPIEHGTPTMPHIPKLKPSPAPGPSIYDELP